MEGFKEVHQGLLLNRGQAGIARHFGPGVELTGKSDIIAFPANQK